MLPGVLYTVQCTCTLCTSIATLSNVADQIVKGPSTSQALKGILTAGPYKAVRYSLAKLKKMFKSMIIQ